MIDAAAQFDGYRLPELFGGNARESGAPLHYPIACQPQAWAAGAIPFMITNLLGLEPDAFNGRLRIVRPLLPENTNRLDLHDLQIGPATIDLSFERTAVGVSARVQKRCGEVVVEGCI
jgi:glycogen debranching enzyme